MLTPYDNGTQLPGMTKANDAVILCRLTPVEHRAKRIHYFIHVCLAVSSMRVWQPNFCQYVILLITSTRPAQPILFDNLG